MTDLVDALHLEFDTSLGHRCAESRLMCDEVLDELLRYIEKLETRAGYFNRDALIVHRKHTHQLFNV